MINSCSDFAFDHFFIKISGICLKHCKKWNSSLDRFLNSHVKINIETRDTRAFAKVFPSKTETSKLMVFYLKIRKKIKRFFFPSNKSPIGRQKVKILILIKFVLLFIYILQRSSKLIFLSTIKLMVQKELIIDNFFFEI